MSVAPALLALLAGALLSLGCQRGSSERVDAPAHAWRYQLTLDATLSKLDATVCFEGVVPRELRAGRDEAASRLLYARWLGPGARRRLPVRDGRIQLDDSTRDGCVGYGVSLAEGGSMDAAVRRIGADMLASPTVWLWRPERREREAHATVELTLPAGYAALLPWPRVGSVYQLDAEAFRFDSYAAFGRFTPHRSSEHGVEIEAALLDGELTVAPDAALRWLRASVHLASLSDGQFPRRRLSAIIVPSPAQHDPVAFGMVARGGSASVLLLVSADAREPALLADWVLPHELSHLLLPFVEREHAWLSEGLATYYQEVLLARAGVSSERDAWRRLAGSLREAAREGDESTSLLDESAKMQLSRNYHKVYWGGAAFWLQVDVELRRRSSGHVSIDQVLSRLRAEEASAREVWTARSIVARLDELSQLTVFSEALAGVEAQHFPTFEPTLTALGVRGEGAQLSLDDAAPLAELRRQMFALTNETR